MCAAKLQKWFPWTTSPIICNGPMLNVACASLGVEVSKAGGIGFIASSVVVSDGSDHLKKLDADLAECQAKQGDSSSPLRVGISFITGHQSITQFTQNALSIIAKHKPAAVWLFAPEESVKPHSTIIKAVKSLEPPPRVFVQVGNVTAAREAVQDGADILVCQGIDAGGHQFRRGMGVISFVPEVKQMLADEFADRQIPVFAAGGIVNGKGVAAALALGADGIVMGTRFTVSEESTYPEFRKQLVLSAKDGGTSTLKSPFNDQINNNALWGPLYDGRAIISEIHQQFLNGASLEECQAALKTHAPDDATKLISTWAGTGVGLVDKVMPAGEIVKEVRDEAKEVIRKLAGSV